MSKIVHPDLILAEGLGYWDMRVFSKKYGREKMVLHLHHEKKSDINYKKVYGNVITTSEFIKKSWMKGESIDSECIHVVKNGIDFLRFQRDFNGEEKRILMEKLGIKKNDFVVMYSGRIVPVKGVKELVLAWKYLSGQDIKLLIVGGTNFADSVNSSYLEEIQKFSKNDDRILLTGYVPNDKLYQYYNIAKVLIVPSLCEEAAGLVAIEGMICGLPLIITKSGGLREYVTSNCSIQLERDKNLSQNIAKAIDKFKADRKLYENYSKNAIETAKKYSGETYWSQLQKVLSSILEEK